MTLRLCPYCHRQTRERHLWHNDPTAWDYCPEHGLLDDLDPEPHKYPNPEGHQMTNNPLLLSVPEAARRLGLSEATVRRMVAAGTLRTFTPVTRAYVIAADLDAYLAAPTETEDSE